MSEWKEDPLENITIFIKDGSHGSHRDCENGIPLLSAKDIVDGKVIIPDDCRRISEKDYDQIHSNYEIQQNDLALTIVGTIGRVALVEYIKQKFTFQRSVGLFRINSSILNPVYCYHYFTSHQFQQALERSKNASAQGGVYLGELANIRISYPKEYTMQRRIAHILSTCDALIEKTQAAIAKYKAIKQGMMHDLFTRGIDITTGKLRPKHEDAPEMYKKSKLGMVPKEWVVDAITELIKRNILDDIQDGNHGEIHPKSNDFVPIGIPFIMASDISNDRIHFENCHKISFELYQTLRIGFSKAGDILLSHKASIGFVARVPSNIKEIMLTPQVTYYRVLNEELLEPNYLEHYLRSDLFQIPLHNLAKQSTRDYIGITMQKTLDIAYPLAIKEQKAIAGILFAVQKKLKAEQSYMRKLQSIKQGLMADLLSAKKRVPLSEEVIPHTEN